MPDEPDRTLTQTPPPPLDPPSLREAVARLAAADPDLGRVVDRHGPPPLWAREPGFATLIHLILEQQVSLASARAAMDRLLAAIGSPEPSTLLDLDDGAMREIGFSRQKRDYARGLARLVLEGALDLESLAEKEDSAARERLMRVRGIGPWTADIYLLMALRRPDVWPAGDRALVVALGTLEGLPDVPEPEEARAIAEAWRPWRSAAARILWHLYLSEIRPPRGAERSAAGPAAR